MLSSVFTIFENISQSALLKEIKLQEVKRTLLK